MPEIKRKYELTEEEKNYPLFTEPRDLGDKQVGIKPFVKGRSGAVLGRVEQEVANPQITLVPKAFTGADAVKTASVQSPKKAFTGADAVKTASVTSVYETSVA